MESADYRALLFTLISVIFLIHFAEGDGSRCPPWCIAKPDASDDVIQGGLNWVCRKGGVDCTPITPYGPCHANGDLKKLASYAFNEYFQKVRSLGGQCTFGDGIEDKASMLTNDNPSFDRCQFTCSPI